VKWRPSRPDRRKHIEHISLTEGVRSSINVGIRRAMLNCVQVKITLRWCLELKNHLRWNAPCKSEPHLGVVCRRYFNLEEICVCAQLRISARDVKDHEKLLIDDLVLLHSALNSLSSSVADLIHAYSPPRTPERARTHNSSIMVDAKDRYKSLKMSPLLRSVNNGRKACLHHWRTQERRFLSSMPPSRNRRKKVVRRVSEFFSEASFQIRL